MSYRCGQTSCHVRGVSQAKHAASSLEALMEQVGDAEITSRIPIAGPLLGMPDTGSRRAIQQRRFPRGRSYFYCARSS
jgi:hypothetical protein